MNQEPPPNDLGRLPLAAPGQSYWLHVSETDGTEYKLARNWPKHSIFVHVSDGGTEETVTYAQRTNDGEIKVPIPRGADWREVWATEPKVDGSLIMWSRRCRP
jgi:hypothetical protein